MSMMALAYKADMEYMQLSRIELGKINTSVQQLYKLCVALEINLSELFASIENEINNEIKNGKNEILFVDFPSSFLFNTNKIPNK